MPESEAKPRLIELVDPGAGQGWKAVLKNGKSVVVHEIPVPPAEAAGAVPRIQRLFEHKHPALSPVLAWGTDPNGLWVAVEPNEGVPLGTILSRGPLTPPAAAALGAALLSGVAALHETGIAMGGFGAAAVRVTGNGEVRLAGHPAGAVRGAPSQSDLRADVRSSGMAICAAFGVDPAGAPAPPNIPPGLVVTMRSMASGAMGPAADRAQGALREMAAALLAPDRATASQAELATRAGGREMPSITPFLPNTDASAPAEPPPFVPMTPRDETPLPRAAASYDPPPRAPEPKAPAPPTPSAYAPYTPPAEPEAPPEPPAPVPPPFVTSPPAAFEPSPATTSPPPAAPNPTTTSPFGATVPPPVSPPQPSSPAIPSWDTAPPAEAPKEAPSAPAYEPPPATPQYEPPSSTPTPSPAPATSQQTWTPVATPAWNPSDSPAAKAAVTEPEIQAWTGGALPAASDTEAPRTSTVPPPTPARKPSVARPDDREPRERPGWLVPAAIVVVILLLIGIGGGIYLATRGNTPGGVATNTPKATPKATAKTTPKTSPSPTTGGPQTVPNYGPASAAPVTSVAFCVQTTHPCQGLDAAQYTNCKLGSSCRVMVEMSYSSPQRTNVSYTLKFFNRCTGVTTDLPGANFTPNGFTRVDLQKQVTLPTGAKSAALVAVSKNPAVAASAPLLLGSPDTC
ncbi:MAG TPA: hypothetical protein VNG70_07145 [Candidatus Limnocylindria bacterium]|nr:hypothetical protein [Candidatus Limnocylindria bacterium]